MNRFILLFLVTLITFSGSIVQAQKYRTFQDKKKVQAAATPSAFNPISISGRHRGRARLASGTPSYAPLHFNLSDTTHLKIQKMVYDQERVVPIYIEGTLQDTSKASTQARNSPVAASHAYLEQVKEQMHITNPGEEFVVRDIQTDAMGVQHIRMQQQYQGVKVYQAEVILHTQATLGATTRQRNYAGAVALPGQINRLNGRYLPTPGLQFVDPSITKEQAVAAAIQDLQGHAKVTPLSKSQQQFLQYDGPVSELIIYQPEQATNQPLLSWHLTIRPNFVERWEYFVDAQTGEVIDFYNHTCHIDGPLKASATDLSGTTRQIQTYEVGGWQYLIDATRSMFDPNQSAMPDDPVGAILTLDAQNQPYTDFELFHVRSQNNTWDDPASVSAHYNGSKAYEYYLNTHGRNSINGQGGRIISIVNVTDEDGSGLDNAFWNGAAMLYGNGNTGFTALAKSLDVAGHEMTHGVIGNSANLEYRNESGAINESIADIFGVLIEREQDDWQLGEDVVVRDYFPSGALRDLEDPHNGGFGLDDGGYQPAHVDEQYFGDEDNGGVHINSGIVNHAFYLFATSNSIGLEKAEKVYYHALTSYLTSLSQFVDLRIAVIQAATDLYGEGSDEVLAAQEAFSAVGIEDGETTEPKPDLPTASGEEYILSYDVNEEDETTLYQSSTEGTDYVALTTSEVVSKPSVADDGSLAVFVSDDQNLHVIALQGEAEESVIQDEGIWKTVALSKDGTKIAAVTTDIDTSIYVYDFNTERWAKFQLYNPSYAKGIQTDEVLYADALEWDYTGEYLMYDAFNQFEGADGVDIEFWDVGFIKVWNNETNDFGDGDIQKLFTSLPEGASIGNASFSKNSPSIVAFDYADFHEETYGVVTADLVTGAVEAVYSNTRLGFPNYSSGDDKIIFDAEDEVGNEVIAVIEMQEDKLKPVEGSAKILIPDASWGIWFTQGERQILSTEKQMLNFGFKDLNPAANGIIKGDSILVNVPEDTDLTSLVPTYTHSDLSVVEVDEVVQSSGITAQDYSAPVIYTVIAEDGSAKDFIVSVKYGPGQVLSSEKDMLTFKLMDLNPVVTGRIKGDSILVQVPEDTDVTGLAPTFTHSALSVVTVDGTTQESGTTVQDFSDILTYTVTAEDGSERAYFVAVSIQPEEVLSSEKDMLTFVFETIDPVAEGEIAGDSITLLVPDGTDLKQLVASFTASALASVRVRNMEQQSGVTANDFTQPIDYNVIAEDGSFQTYVVIVSIDQSTGIGDNLVQIVSFYPNPVEETLTIAGKAFTDLPVEVIVYDILGNKVYEQQWETRDQSSRTIPMESLAPGFYMVNAKTTAGMVTQKIIKQ